MSVWEIFLIGVGLSMDAFAVSICKGLGMTKINKKQTLSLAFFFGGFQALMPLLGYFLGYFFYDYINRFGSWISFLLLAIIGANMIRETIKEIKEDCGCEEKTDPPLPIAELFMLAIATSIDAFAVGVTFSLLSVNIFLSVIIIGCTTFILSYIAVYLGNIAGSKYGSVAKIIGGIILILIGLKILITALLF